MELRLPLEVFPGRQATCRAVFGTWGSFPDDARASLCPFVLTSFTPHRVFHYMNTLQLIYSTVNEHLRCFQLGAITDNDVKEWPFYHAQTFYELGICKGFCRDG